MAKKKIYNLFPVPIFQYKIENYQEINQELLNYILELQKKNKIGNTHSNRGGWHSPNFDLVNEGPPINFINKFKDFDECSKCSLITKCSRSSGSAYINTKKYTGCDPTALTYARARSKSEP